MAPLAGLIAAAADHDDGNLQAARDYYRTLLIIAAEHDTERPELKQAKAFLSRR